MKSRKPHQRHQQFSWIAVLLFCISCSPTIYYLGDSFQPTSQIDIYYDEKDIEQEYRTIGKMTHGNFFDYELETIKEKMIRKVKENGGDAIIFMEVKNIREGDNHDQLFDEDRLSITANVIKYEI